VGIAMVVPAPPAVGQEVKTHGAPFPRSGVSDKLVPSASPVFHLPREKRPPIP